MQENPFASPSSYKPNMISPSSSFKPKLKDQDYMELVCENGQILAKSPSPNNNGSFQIPRTQSLLELYETEYYEGFKNNLKNTGNTQVVPVNESKRQQDEQTNNDKKKIKSTNIEFERNVSKSNKRVESSTLIDGSGQGSLKNVQVITAPPDQQSVAVGRSKETYFASSSMFSLNCCSLKRRYGDIQVEEEEESTYSSNNNSDDESDDARTNIHARNAIKPVTKRKRSTEVHKLSERKRRNEINEKMRALQDLLPNYYKDDKVSLLDEAIKYMRTLQLQVQMMSIGNGLIQPPTMLPLCHYSAMGLGMHMGTAAAAATTTTSIIPQIMPRNIVQGTSFPAGFNNASSSSSQMLNYLNHQYPTGLIPNSPNFSPLEIGSHHQEFVVPSCVPQAQTTSFTQFPSSASTSKLENEMKFRGRNDYHRFPH